ncbi:uncharacterized protein A4U43_C01F7110 [Asparagus officinalis]|uniref:Protein LUTEIN DEFICIENT 5, chloroplastic n=1 Tax=Asparagus officinalis TaxID=4686 RepID=A0A5P1FN18_ASPOF|nr:uncharacterized protein A4U43_C01F7110 [Asparagus officinalis]
MLRVLGPTSQLKTALCFPPHHLRALPSSRPWGAGMASAQLLQFSRLPPQFPRTTSQSPTYYRPCHSAAGTNPRRSIRCWSSSSGRSPEPESGDSAVKDVERLLEEKRRAELAARIASGEFTVGQSGLVPTILSGLGPAGKFLAEFVERLGGGGGREGDRPEIPQARGSIAAVGGQAFFIPLYELFLTYVASISDPRRILRDNSKAYSKGILAEILEFVMGTGLIPADGEIWRVRRRAIVPALHQKYVAAMISLFGEASNRLCDKLDAAASDGEDVEMESLFSRLTLDIIGKAVFNYEFDSLSVDNGIVEAVYTVLREAEMRSTSPIPTWEIPIWKDISPRQKKANEALKLINTTLDELIAICKRMVEQEELQFHEEYMNEQDPSILHFLLASGDDVSSKQLRDDLMTMLIAGHETSAAVLTWTFYLLSQNPRVMAKLQEEVDTVLGDRFPTIEDMKKLKYTTRVINESLRLYPQPPVLIRRSQENDVLGKYPITRGEDIFISVWNLHRSPKHWVDAEKFNPERWPLDGPNPNETNQNFSYLPFGGGPRKCVGDMFATFETVVATAMLVRRFNFQIAVGAPPVEMTTGATIHTTEGLKMTVTRRTRPPVIPTLEAKEVLTIDGSNQISNGSSIPEGDQQGEVSTARL